MHRTTARKLRPIGILGLGLLSTSFACSAVSDDGESSESAHTKGQIVWTNAPQGWADVDRAVFDARDAAQGEKTAPVTSPVSRRLQGWVDKYDGIARTMIRATGTELAAPQPRARIEIDPAVNAGVTAIQACIATGTGTPPAGVQSEVVLLGPQNIFPGAPTGGCLTARNWSAESGLTWFNKLGGMKVVPGGSVIRVQGGGVEKAKGARASIRAAAPFVNVNTGLVASLSEKGVAVAIAHEVAHYFRTHNTTGVDGKYDFWFDRDEHVAERPTPVANQAEYTEQFNRLKLPRFSVPGQKLHPRLGETLVSWLHQAELNRVPLCEAAQQALVALGSNARFGLVEGDPRKPLSYEMTQAYLDIESKFIACLDTIQTVEGDPAPETVAGPQGKMIDRGWLVKNVSESLRKESPAEDIAATRTLRQLVGVLEASSRRLDAAGPEFLRRLYDNHIGHYTAEQEADELSMELATQVGLTPTEVIDAYVELMFASEKANPQRFMTYNGMPAARCRDLAAAGFKEGEDQLHVALGQLDEPHHAFCYRLFNLQREMKAHDYPKVAPNFPRSPEPWTDIQSAALKLQTPGATPEAPPTKPEPAPGNPATAAPETPSSPGLEMPPSAAGDTLEPTPDAPPSKPARSASGCATSPGNLGSSNASYGWTLAVGLASLFVRRRKAQRRG